MPWAYEKNKFYWQNTRYQMFSAGLLKLVSSLQESDLTDEAMPVQEGKIENVGAAYNFQELNINIL